MRLKPLILCVVVAVLVAVAGVPLMAQEPLVVFAVRHAERADSSDDAELSETGVQRAQDLAALLRDAGIEHIHSTDYVRTRNTVAPLADALGLDVEIYGSGTANIVLLLDQIRNTGSRHLIVGHSDTIPVAVRLLGGDPGLEPGAATPDYDRLYVVTVSESGEASTLLLRYGTPDEGDEGSGGMGMIGYNRE